jgi:hypothetical protein
MRYVMDILTDAETGAGAAVPDYDAWKTAATNCVDAAFIARSASGAGGCASGLERNGEGTARPHGKPCKREHPDQAAP